MNFQITPEFARERDQHDPLRPFRAQFHIPQHEGNDVIYFTGNSLGLQPKSTAARITEELEDWARWGVEGHTEARRPWLKYHEFFTDGLAQLVGAKPTEVVAMNGLTVNLHLLMVSFFRPTANRRKIICEAKAFPSDQYAIHSQLRFHGCDPKADLIEISPEPGAHLIDEAQIYAALDAHAHEAALLLIGGVNYYTGQVFDMEGITAYARERGVTVGWDLAHAAGNVEVRLHDWGVDFAAWCSYKYLNSGPGAVSGCFIHERHHTDASIPRFEGWWGTNKERRFLMEPEFDAIQSAEAWQLSNAPVLSMTPLLSSLELFAQAGLERLRAKRDELTAYLEWVIQEVGREAGDAFEIITPSERSRRGSQLSVLLHGRGKEVFDYLQQNGVIADWREPNVIRMAPVPMYNSFEDVQRFAHLFKNALKHTSSHG